MKCFIDMDGVLADYFTAAEKLMEVEHYSQANFEETVKAIKNIDRDNTDRSMFFTWLVKLPNADRLIEAVTNIFGEYSIITTPLKSHEMPAMLGKMAWISRELKIKPKSVIFTDNKAQFAGRGRILIDDYRHNINQWEAAGGIGVKYKALSKNYTVEDVIEKMRSLKAIENINRRPPPPPPPPTIDEIVAAYREEQKDKEKPPRPCIHLSERSV